MNETRTYAVSTGNGNDGVTHLYPDYTVTAPVDSEFTIARLAMISKFDRGHYRQWAKSALDVNEHGQDGAQACLYDPPGRDGRGWSEHNGAWRIVDVYPVDEVSDNSTAPHYDSLAAAFGAAFVRHNAKDV